MLPGKSKEPDIQLNELYSTFLSLKTPNRTTEKTSRVKQNNSIHSRQFEFQGNENALTLNDHSPK